MRQPLFVIVSSPVFNLLIRFLSDFRDGRPIRSVIGQSVQQHCASECASIKIHDIVAMFELSGTSGVVLEEQRARREKQVNTPRARPSLSARAIRFSPESRASTTLMLVCLGIRQSVWKWIPSWTRLGRDATWISLYGTARVWQMWGRDQAFEACVQRHQQSRGKRLSIMHKSGYLKLGWRKSLAKSGVFGIDVETVQSVWLDWPSPLANFGWFSHDLWCLKDARALYHLRNMVSCSRTTFRFTRKSPWRVSCFFLGPARAWSCAYCYMSAFVGRRNGGSPGQCPLHRNCQNST